MFREWLERTQPGRLRRIEGRIRSAGGGKVNDFVWGTQMCGTGEMAAPIGNLFRLLARRYGLDGGLPPYDRTCFRPPRTTSGQLSLF